MINHSRPFRSASDFRRLAIRVSLLSSARSIDAYSVSFPIDNLRISLRRVSQQLDLRSPLDHNVSDLHGLYHRIDFRSRHPALSSSTMKSWQKFWNPYIITFNGVQHIALAPLFHHFVRHRSNLEARPPGSRRSLSSDFLEHLRWRQRRRRRTREHLAHHRRQTITRS